MNLENFLKEQEKNYNEIRALLVLETGAEADPALQERRGGFFISLIHADELTQSGAKISAEIAHIVPSVSYGTKDIHTTLGRVKQEYGPHFYCNPDKEPSVTILQKLKEVVKEALTDVIEPYPRIAYSDYLVTRHAVIAVGTPNEWFVKFTGALIKKGGNCGIEIIPPWGAHITMGRFTEKIPRNEITRLADLLKRSVPLGVSFPVAVATGYTARKPDERLCANLKDTPGHFKSVNRLALSFRNPL